MTWTSIITQSTTYTNVNTSGNHIYDDSLLTYDDSNTYYDDINPSMWSSVASNATSWTSIQS